MSIVGVNFFIHHVQNLGTLTARNVAGRKTADIKAIVIMDLVSLVDCSVSLLISLFSLTPCSVKVCIS